MILALPCMGLALITYVTGVLCGTLFERDRRRGRRADIRPALARATVVRTRRPS